MSRGSGRNGSDDIVSMCALMGSLSGHRVGDMVQVAGLGSCKVIELLPPALLRVRTLAGGVAKVGVRAAHGNRQV